MYVHLVQVAHTEIWLVFKKLLIKPCQHCWAGFMVLTKQVTGVMILLSHFACVCSLLSTPYGVV